MNYAVNEPNRGKRIERARESHVTARENLDLLEKLAKCATLFSPLASRRVAASSRSHICHDERWRAHPSMVWRVPEYCFQSIPREPDEWRCHSAVLWDEQVTAVRINVVRYCLASRNGKWFRCSRDATRRSTHRGSFFFFFLSTRESERRIFFSAREILFS